MANRANARFLATPPSIAFHAAGSEFRNPHYHLPSDTPDTLDYDFLRDVAKLALARVASSA